MTQDAALRLLAHHGEVEACSQQGPGASDNESGALRACSSVETSLRHLPEGEAGMSSQGGDGQCTQSGEEGERPVYIKTVNMGVGGHAFIFKTN